MLAGEAGSTLRPSKDSANFGPFLRLYVESDQHPKSPPVSWQGQDSRLALPDAILGMDSRLGLGNPEILVPFSRLIPKGRRTTVFGGAVT